MAKTLATIVVAGALALGGAGCYTKSSENHTPKNEFTNQAQPQYQTGNISGTIIGIDEDSFAMSTMYGGTSFEFEHFRIEALDGKTYKFIFPGPSNYQVGDKVDFQYRAQQQVSYRDLLNDGTVGDLYSLQDGFFNVDGVIQR